MVTNSAVTQNDGEIMTESAIGIFDVAICFLCAILVPRLVSRHRLYHRTLRKSPKWVAQNVVATTESEASAAHGYAGGDPVLAAANRAVNAAMLQTILGALVVYVAAAITLSLLSRGLDIRTTYILKGISFFIGSVCIFGLSFCAPQWLAVYAHAGAKRRIDLGQSLASFQTRIRLKVSITFLKIFPFMAPFFCGALPETIPLSMITGLLMGFFLCLVVDWGNRTIKAPQHLQYFALIVAFFFVFCSAYMFSYGCGYVQDVWGDRKGQVVTELDWITFFVWLVAGLFLHGFVWGYTSQLHADAAEDEDNDEVVARPRTFFGKSVYLSKRPGAGFVEDADKKAAEVEHMDQIGEEGEEAEEEEGTMNSAPKQRGLVPAPEEPQEQAPGDEDRADDDIEESRCMLINVVCCKHTCGQGGKDKACMRQASIVFLWFIWILLYAASMFFILIMVGSMQQEATVKKTLPFVKTVLYSTMNDGEMCAFDNRNPTGNLTRREKVETTQRTFSTPEEVELAGYTILHCGACGKCSNWHDLRLEYATRNILGPVALKCSKKTLFGGTYDDLVDCTMEETTFQEPCAKCWATDYQCTKKNCKWIGLRSFMINTVTNLQVGENDITPATCEEAMCEATEVTKTEGFVPCSGASRRRMNVVSTIKRPKDQQCNVVDVKWEEFFGPSEGELDYDPEYDNIVD